LQYVFSIYIFSFAVCFFLYTYSALQYVFFYIHIQFCSMFFLYTYSVLQYVFSIYIFSFTTCLFHIHSQSCDLSLRLSVKLRNIFCSLCLFRFAIFIGVLFSFVIFMCLIQFCDIFCVLRLFGFAILLCVLYTYSVLQYLDVSYSVL
jgi:hypothetical protein